MRVTDDGLRFSPSDVNNFLACEHLPALDLARAEGKITLNKAPRPDADLIRERGIRHEMRFLEQLESTGLDVVRIPEDLPTTKRAELTDAAMRDGAGAIHQGGFLDDGWVGYSDFLLRVPEESALGDWSYEAYDAKLAAHPKPYFILQLIFYTEQVGRVQGRLPDRMHLILGTQEVRSYRPTDFQAYSAQVRKRYLAYLADLRRGEEPPYPYKVDHCDYCDWWARCRDKRRSDDHVSLVAFLGRGQAVKLDRATVHTVEQLAALPAGTRVPRLAATTLAGLQEQASLQVEARETGLRTQRFLSLEPERGFARLPAPSPGDVFFDIEGDPYWEDDGLEYLFGSTTPEDDYIPIWAHSRAEEQRAFEQWMDWVTRRLGDDPDMHIYHYNAYEPTAVKNLMSRYGTREHEVDELLRRKVFVDLYVVVRQAMRIGKESYSLKSVEDYYDYARDAEVTDAGGSLLAYQEYLESLDQTKLDAIAAYNADDCRSTAGLRDWLLEQRAEAEKSFGVDISTFQPQPAKAVSPEKQVLLDELTALRDGLNGGLPDDETQLTEAQQARRLLADLLEYHHREEKPQWWAYFDRMTKSIEELRDEDSEAIADLTLAAEIPKRDEKLSWIYPLRFPAQQYKLSPGDVIDPETEKTIKLVEVDDENGLVWVKRAKRSDAAPLPRALAPIAPIPQRSQQEALRALARRVVAAGLEPSGTLDSACDLLAKRRPRIRGLPPGSPLQTDRVDIDALADQIAELQGSALFVQGPPGSGKTWTASRVIVQLLARGLRVGVAATAHKAIHKLLDDIEQAAAERSISFRGLKKSSGYAESEYESIHVEHTGDNAAFPPALGEYDLVAGTPWLWSRENMREAVDVLFLDEAGQVALADALAVSQGAKNIVLMGDPQQLAHVSQGTHPRGSGSSVLEHLLGGEHTVAPDRGVFLDRTWRMHPDVCSFISTVMYDGRLSPVLGLENQRIDSPGLSGSGTRTLFVEHVDNRQQAPEEADRIASEVDRLLDGGTWTDAEGGVHRLTPDDILVVAPYNAQVRCLRAKLPSGVRVGTVDKFQGQQAPVVFFSMTSSSGEDVPRGMDFLFSRNRLNVAVSRAQAMSVVACAPSLLWARCSNVEQMRLVNALCSYAAQAESCWEGW
jgi:predicted RecB family nuclease